jgi:hypothetical protein
MADAGNHVRVPKPSPASFNKSRPVKENTLLRNQVKHFHELETRLLEKLRTGIRFEDIRTEGDAAEYIRRMTAILHPHLGRRKKK